MRTRIPSSVVKQAKSLRLPLERCIIDGVSIADVDSGTVPNVETGRAWLEAPGELRISMYESPLGKPRMTQRDKWKQRTVVLAYRAWCDRLRSVIGTILPDASAVASLSWQAYFVPPESWSKKRRLAAIGTLHRQKPDRDNIDKAILDCLYPKVDSEIAAGTIEKRWCHNSRLEITIRFLS